MMLCDAHCQTRTPASLCALAHSQTSATTSRLTMHVMVVLFPALCHLQHAIAFLRAIAFLHLIAFPGCNRILPADTKGKDWEILSHTTKQTEVPLQYHSYSKDLCLSVPNVPKIVPWSPVFGQNTTRNRWALPHVCLSGITPSRDHLPGLPLSLHVCILKPSGTWAEEPIHTEVCVPSHTPNTHPRGEDLRIFLELHKLLVYLERNNTLRSAVVTPPQDWVFVVRDQVRSCAQNVTTPRSC